jgi:diguanylate cyclase (GGDEF)-like protein/putative nucleotidyltransferase with HDIG domain
VAEDSGSLSLGYVITFAAILRFGPTAGLVIGGISALSGCVYPRMMPMHQLTFNVSLAAIQSWFSGVVFVVANGGTLNLHPIGSFLGVFAAATTYFIINTGGVACVVGLFSHKPIWPLWKKTFLWTGPTYLAGASITSLAIILTSKDLSGTSPLIAWLLLGSPAALVVYMLYSVFRAREADKQSHIEELEAKKAQLADLYLATIKSLALAIDAKDQYTHQHIIRVQRYAMATASKLGLSEVELQGLETGALLHDIGKLGVPEYVLLKPGRLTDDEFDKIKKHPEIGAAILDPVEFPWPVLPVVKYHHEKWDGTGYPEGLKGLDIPLTARILAVGDVYDALTSHRSYRNAWTHEKALQVIKEGRGTHFDPQIVDAFLEIIDNEITAMAREGVGPLAIENNVPPAITKADQAARDIQRASSELWALYEVAQTLSTSLGLAETLDILARKLHAILPGTACVFLLRDDSVTPQNAPFDKDTMGTLIVRSAVGLNREFFDEATTVGAKTRPGASMQVAQSRQTYCGDYDPEDLMLKGSPTSQWVAVHSALIVPIVHQGEVLGTINLYHPEPNAFGPHDRQFLEMVAERASLALYNGLLFDRARSHAFTDPLTGLYNLRYLTQYVDERCSADTPLTEYVDPELNDLPDQSDLCDNRPIGGRRRSDAFALLCLDLDSFKPINDNFGHQRGDQVLRDVSRIFLSTVRDTDIVARYGGDEFIVVQQGAGPQEAALMAQKLQEAVEQYDPGLVHARLGPLRLGVSVGYACYPLDGYDCATLLAGADTQMYNDKTERDLARLATHHPVEHHIDHHHDHLPDFIIPDSTPQ